MSAAAFQCCSPSESDSLQEYHSDSMYFGRPLRSLCEDFFLSHSQTPPSRRSSSHHLQCLLRLFYGFSAPSVFLLTPLLAELFVACDTVLIKTGIGFHLYHLLLVSYFLAVTVSTGSFSSVALDVTAYNVGLAVKTSLLT